MGSCQPWSALGSRKAAVNFNVTIKAKPEGRRLLSIIATAFMPYLLRLQFALPERHDEGCDSPNGLSVIRDLDENLFAEVANAGYPVTHCNWASARRPSLAQIGATNRNDPILFISRQRLWDCLREHVPDSAIADGRAVSGMSYSRGHRLKIHFAEGSAELGPDLVIGADGVESVVKRFVTGDGQSDDHPACHE
ncbi:MAG: hypothetical protein LQ344_003725 [Seirophora lacunosa]|nr:MAG: hypothetical protein LQ344_003725 [Seirophora lacunosa]